MTYGTDLAAELFAIFHHLVPERNFTFAVRAGAFRNDCITHLMNT